MIHLLQQLATDRQITEMLEVHESYIKVAVDIQRGLLAGGGEFHADCESVLVEDGSRREDVWGADWIPQEQMEIQDPVIRRQVDTLVRKLLQGISG